VTIAIISDTHMPKGSRQLGAPCLERLRDAAAIVHAGDLITLVVLEQLQGLGPPVTAVRGNVDDAVIRASLPETARVRVGPRTIAVIHDAGPAAGRLQRMRRRFPDADAVVFGHSHIPLHETAPDGFQILNPGSPTERRQAAHHTMALGTLDGDGRLAFRIVTLD
jgi:putative phosphoesterase